MPSRSAESETFTMSFDQNIRLDLSSRPKRSGVERSAVSAIPNYQSYRCMVDRNCFYNEYEERAAMKLWTGISCLVANPECEIQEIRGCWERCIRKRSRFGKLREDFAGRVGQTAAELDCILLELDGIKLLDSRMEEPDRPEELITMQETAQRQPKRHYLRDLSYLGPK